MKKSTGQYTTIYNMISYIKNQPHLRLSYNLLNTASNGLYRNLYSISDKQQTTYFSEILQKKHDRTGQDCI